MCVSGVEEALITGWVLHLQQLISLVQLQEEVGGGRAVGRCGGGVSGQLAVPASGGGTGPAVC